MNMLNCLHHKDNVGILCSYFIMSHEIKIGARRGRSRVMWDTEKCCGHSSRFVIDNFIFSLLESTIELGD